MTIERLGFSKKMYEENLKQVRIQTIKKIKQKIEENFKDKKTDSIIIMWDVWEDFWRKLK